MREIIDVHDVLNVWQHIVEYERILVHNYMRATPIKSNTKTSEMKITRCSCTETIVKSVHSSFRSVNRKCINQITRVKNCGRLYRYYNNIAFYFVYKIFDCIKKWVDEYSEFIGTGWIYEFDTKYMKFAGNARQLRFDVPIPVCLYCWVIWSKAPRATTTTTTKQLHIGGKSVSHFLFG